MASGLHTHLRQLQDGGNAEHRNDIDDLENREINAGEIYGVCPKWAHGVGTRSGAEEPSWFRIPKHHSGFARPEVGGSRRSVVPEGLRVGWISA